MPTTNMSAVSVAPSYTHEAAEVTSYEARVKLARDGRCPDHPDIQLQKRKLMKWKTVREECPRCKEEFKLKTQCCPVHPGIIMTKTRKFQCGVWVRHLVCPLCTEEEISEGKKSKKDLAKDLKLLNTQYAEVASDTRLNCKELQELRAHITSLEKKLTLGQDVETNLLNELLEAAVPMMEDLIAASERTAPPAPVEHIQAIRANMLHLEAQIKKCEGSSQQLVANAMQEVFEQLESIRNDHRMLAIKTEEQRQAFRKEIDELQNDLDNINGTMKKLPAQVHWNTETLSELKKDYKSFQDRLDEKLAEYESITIDILERLASLEKAVAREPNATSERRQELQQELHEIAEATPVVVDAVLVSDNELERVTVPERIEALQIELQQENQEQENTSPSNKLAHKDKITKQELESVVSSTATEAAASHMPSKNDDVKDPAVSTEPEFDHDRARKLLEEKLANPSYQLKYDDSIAVLSLCVEDGIENAARISGKDAVVVLGNTGSGKSTLVNYLLGCDMCEKSPKELGVKGLKKLIVVKSVAEGGRRDEIMAIGHSKTSKTFVPKIVPDPSCDSLVYCDCPGFLDNRGAEINIANAVNMKLAMKQANHVKVIILINYHSLLADRGRGLTDMLTICSQLFGSTSNVSRNQGSIFLGVTQAPEDIDMESLKEWLLDDTPDIMNVLAERLFLCDPLDRGGEDFWTRDECIAQIAQLHAIPQNVSETMFQTVLTANDETTLMQIVDRQSKSLRDALRKGDFLSAGACWRLLQCLRAIDNISVERMLSAIQLRLQHEVSKRVALFRDCCPHYQFEEAEAQLLSLRELRGHFPEGDLDLDLESLSKHFTFFKEKQISEKEREQRYIDEQRKFEEETSKLLEAIDRQKSETTSHLTQLVEKHSEETLKLQEEMARQSSLHDAQIAKLKDENVSALRKQEELLALSQALSEEERMKLVEDQNQLMMLYAKQLEQAENEKAIFQVEVQNMLAQQEKTQLESKQALEAHVVALEMQRIETEQANERRQWSLALEWENERREELIGRANAFGAHDWAAYFHGHVDDDEMPLPNHINEILDGPCPFWSGKKVRDTHIITLIPAIVDGRAYTLRVLADLCSELDRPASLVADTAVVERLGNEMSTGPYWLLVTRGVIPRSLNLLYADQKAMLSQHGYDMPRALETATSIMAHYARCGEKLFATGSGPSGQTIYTRCQEVVSSEGSINNGGCHKAGDYPSLVGGFDDSSSALNVATTTDVAEECVSGSQGVAGCRRLKYRSGSL